jgi:hypothetical protein
MNQAALALLPGQTPCSLRTPWHVHHTLIRNRTPAMTQAVIQKPTGQPRRHSEIRRQGNEGRSPILPPQRHLVTFGSRSTAPAPISSAPLARPASSRYGLEQAFFCIRHILHFCLTFSSLLALYGGKKNSSSGR